MYSSARGINGLNDIDLYWSEATDMRSMGTSR